MKRNQLLCFFICFTLTSILVVVHPVSAAGNLAALLEVKAEILHCNLQQGWCSRLPQVQLIASASGTTIQAIEGSLNGIAFKGEGTMLTLDLVSSSNHLSYWAISSTGLKSDRHYLIVRMQPKNVLAPSIQSLTAVSSSSAKGKTMPDWNAKPSEGLAGQGALHISSSKGQLLLFEAPASFSSHTALVELKETVIQPVKYQGKVLSYIFNQTLHRKQKSAASVDGLQVIPTVYSFVLDDTPPQLGIHPQNAFSGRLTFSGLVADDLSGMKSLRMNINGQWQPLEWRNTAWNYVWDTEKAHVSGGAFTLKLLAKDMAGNTQTASLKFQVLNRTWSLITLWALLLALTVTAVFDPRRKAWRELTALSSRMVALGLADYFKEEE